MKNVAEQQPHAPPGIIATLTAGFELTTAHPWLILLPGLLDVFYWLGPRLGIAQLSDRLLAPLAEEAGTQEAIKQVMDLATNANVLTSLSVPLIGVPALMGGAIPEKTPLVLEVIQLDSMLSLMILQAGLTMMGLFLAAIYLSSISLALQDEKDRPPGPAAIAVTVLKSTVRLLGLGLIFIGALLSIWLPLFPVAYLAGLVAGSLALYIMFAGFLVVATYLSMAVPGIVLKRKPLLKSTLESVRLVKGNVWQTMLLLLVIALVSSGTNRLWRLADDGSWLTLVSIAGHAFIGTSLVAAVFVFYRERRAFVQAQLSDQ